MRNRSVFILAAVLVGAATFFSFNRGIEVEGEIFTNSDGVAIGGYDTVAYFAENQAAKGLAQFAHRWKDAVWHFASPENRDRFAANPERYAPQFGGY